MPSDISKKLQKKLIASARAQGWFPFASAEGILVALSGGGDSMALLALLREIYPGRLVAAHLEHGLRGDASLADAAFVRDYCADIGIECIVRHEDVAQNRLRGESFEAAGRRARYDFFSHVLEDRGLTYIATGHTEDDLVETSVFHFFRGTGVAGLAGISSRRGAIVRPILSCRRDDLRAYLRQVGIPWREDATNALNDHSRNCIRNVLLPWVRTHLNAAADRAVAGLADECRATSQRSKRAGGESLAWLARDVPGTIAAWHTPSARAMDDAKIAAALRRQGEILNLPTLDRARTRTLLRLLRTPGQWRFQWAGDVEVCGAFPLLAWLRRGDLVAPDSAEFIVHMGDSLSFEWGAWKIEAETRRAEALMVRPKNSVWRFVHSPKVLPVRLAVSSISQCQATRPSDEGFSWWERIRRPVIQFSPEGETRNDAEIVWVPGRFSSNTVHEENNCVIIVRVSARKRNHSSL